MLPWRVGSADLGFTYGYHVISAGVGSGSRTSLLDEYCVCLPRTISYWQEWCMIGQSAISLEVPANCNSWASVCCLLFIKFSMISILLNFWDVYSFIYLFIQQTSGFTTVPGWIIRSEEGVYWHQESWKEGLEFSVLESLSRGVVWCDLYVNGIPLAAVLTIYWQGGREMV